VWQEIGTIWNCDRISHRRTIKHWLTESYHWNVYREKETL